MTRTKIVAGWAAAVLGIGAAQAADLPGKAAAPAVPESCKVAISFPAYNGPIKQNPDPACLAIGPLGEFYIGGAFTGYGYTQTNPFPYSATPLLPSDRKERFDFSNLQVFVQKADGPFQVYIQAGTYAIPALGFVNYRAFDQTDLLFGPLPVAYGKYVINDNWSIQGGRMPTLIGSEAPFTFQNLNIQRGLLFNQENIINHGVQVNYAEGPWSLSVAGTDGFYSGDLNWFTGSLSYKLDDANTFGINGGLSLARTNSALKSVRYQYATPLLQQNSAIFNANYTYQEGPWTITPYFQYTTVDRDLRLGILQGASTYGGAVLASYAFTDNFALAGRLEYEEQSGRRTTGVTSLLYGPGSGAFSVTVTPTYTVGRFFLRGEYSHVKLYDSTPGLGFGRAGLRTAQDRFMLETGITF